MDIRFKTSVSTSYLHAVLCREEGFPAADTDLAACLDETTNLLISTLQFCGLACRPTLELLVALASESENNRQLAQLAITRLLGSAEATEAIISPLAAALSGLQAKMLTAQPGLAAELPLRTRPLLDQWEARGPGLLHEVARLTEEGFLAESAEVVFVAPFVGGHGRVNMRTNRVILEAVLANPHSDLPEPLRLGWLLAQLNADLPKYAEVIPGQRQELVAQLATLPVVLAASETVEWSTCDVATIARALECWHLATDFPAELAQLLFSWWQTYTRGSSTWAIAGSALEALLAQEGKSLLR